MNTRTGVIALSLVVLTGIAAYARFAGLDDEDRADVVAADAPADLPIAPVEGESAAPTRLESADEPTAEPKKGRDWTRRAHESTDDFSLAQQLAGAALAGDAQAESVLSDVLLRCETYERILAPYTEGTVAERVEFHLANGEFLERSRSSFRQGALRCERLFSQSPFEGYDLPEDAKDFRYWSNRAAESRDPIAVMNRAVRSAIDRRPSGDAEQERAFREGLLTDVRLAVFSGEAAALFMVGGLFSHPSIGTNADDGYAWLIAACEMGYDCSMSNPNLGPGCASDGTCVAGQTLLDTMQRDFGAAKYASIYANAQDIQYKIRTNDWDGLQQYLKLKE